MSKLKGKRVRLIRMEDPYTNLKKGDEGTILGEDDLNHILVKWDNGSNLNLIKDVDEYKIIESSRIKKFLEFVDNTDSFINAKLSELEDLVNSFTEGKDLMYHWENKNDEAVIITYQIDEDFIKYEFDVDDETITKTVNDEVEFTESVDSVEEGFDMIEKDIQASLGISESYTLILEKNVPTNPELWSACKAWAKSKYDVWPSAYACGAAAKRYKSKGGRWRKKKTKK